MNIILGGLYHYYGVTKSMLWLFFHPSLWHKGIGISGMPKIDGIANLKVGNDVYINDKVYIQCLEDVEIGNNVTISYGSVILTSGLDTENYVENCTTRVKPHKNQKVVIGNGVWLGARTVVLPGVIIADKIVVGAGSVVTKSLDKSGWLYAGVPAKPIKALS